MQSLKLPQDEQTWEQIEADIKGAKQLYLVVTDGGDGTSVLRYAYRPDATQALPLLEMTAQYVAGAADRAYYLNRSGQRGALFGRNRLKPAGVGWGLGARNAVVKS